MKIEQDKVYWIIYSRVRKKYPNKPISVKHMITRRAIEKRQSRLKGDKYGTL